jgi:hypothetical protein
MYINRMDSMLPPPDNESKTLLSPIDYEVHSVQSSTTTTEYSLYLPHFGWSPVDIIQHTFNNTTQFAKSLHLHTDMCKHYKSRFPAFNVIQRNNPVATDTVYSDTAAINDGSKCAQLFVGRHSLVTDVYGMKTDCEFVNTLEHNIRKHGDMEKLVSDRALAEISSKIQHILNAYIIDDWQCEPHRQHQNFPERHYAMIKSRTNIIINRTGAPPNTWLLFFEPYVQ